MALGWNACFLLPGCCDPFNDKALKAGRGAAFKLPLAQGDWQDLNAVLQQQDLQCLGACPDVTSQQQAEQEQKANAADNQRADSQSDDTHGQFSSAQAMCLVMGSEGQGLSNTAMQYVKPVSIPMPGPMESLNVSQAGAILMFALSSVSKHFLEQKQ